MSGSFIMAIVALLCAVAGTVVFLRPAPREQQVYRHRIFATMLITAAIILAGFAYSLHSWEVAA
jgi:hypothetical protein